MHKLIVALDFPNEKRALDLVKTLEGLPASFKVGLQLYTAAGPSVVRQIQGLGAEVFLDLKFFDIPNTVSQAALEAARLGARMLTFHALGGDAMLRQARETLEAGSVKEGWDLPTMLGVTVLTSMDQASVASVGIDRTLESLVYHLAGIVQSAGLHGIVCSPREVESLRNSGFSRLLFVTPGIRPQQALEPGGLPAAPAQAGSLPARDDQARAATARYAISRGAHHLVVGRPITQAENPRQVVEQLILEINEARTERA
ncbi:MAG: orotidine-5'-phosphate decarboxylase [Acidobacteriota bacterium]